MDPLFKSFTFPSPAARLFGALVRLFIPSLFPIDIMLLELLHHILNDHAAVRPLHR